MPNPLYGMFGPKQPSNPMPNMLTAFQNFKMGFQGDPRQKVQDLLQSGQMSQEQLNQLVALANQFRGVFPK